MIKNIIISSLFVPGIVFAGIGGGLVSGTLSGNGGSGGSSSGGNTNNANSALTANVATNAAVGGNLLTTNSFLSWFNITNGPASNIVQSATALTSPGVTLYELEYQSGLLSGISPAIMYADPISKSNLVCIGADTANAQGGNSIRGANGIAGLLQCYGFPPTNNGGYYNLGGLTVVNGFRGCGVADGRNWIQRVKDPSNTPGLADAGTYCLFESRYNPGAPDQDTLFANYQLIDNTGNVGLGDLGERADDRGNGNLYPTAKVTVYGSPNGNYPAFEVVKDYTSADTNTFFFAVSATGVLSGNGNGFVNLSPAAVSIAQNALLPGGIVSYYDAQNNMIMSNIVTGAWSLLDTNFNTIKTGSTVVSNANLSVLNGSLSVSNNSIPTFNVTGNNPLYTEINVQNYNPAGSGDVNVATDKANETTNYMDLGINNSGYVPGVGILGSTNDEYLIGSGRNFFMDVIGGGMNFIWTSQLTTNSAVVTNMVLTSSGNLNIAGTFTGLGTGLTNASGVGVAFGSAGSVPNGLVTNNAVGIYTNVPEANVFDFKTQGTLQAGWTNWVSSSSGPFAYQAVNTNGSVTFPNNVTNLGILEMDSSSPLFFARTGNLLIRSGGGNIILQNASSQTTIQSTVNGALFPLLSQFQGLATLQAGLNTSFIVCTNGYTNISNYITPSNPTNQFTVNTIYTAPALRSQLVGAVFLTSAVAGIANITLVWTNGGVGTIGSFLPMQVGSGQIVSDYIPFNIPLSPNATFQFITGFTGTGTGYVTNAQVSY